MSDQKNIDVSAINGDEINLKELQIKLERIKAYVNKTEGRVAKHGKDLDRLREKILDVENERMKMSVVAKHKLKREI